jgi:hypothetical protein
MKTCSVIADLNTDRPALQRLLDDVRAGTVVDRLTRSLADFAKLVVDVARIEPVSAVEFPATGKLTGNFADSGPPRRF